MKIQVLTLAFLFASFNVLATVEKDAVLQNQAAEAIINDASQASQGAQGQANQFIEEFKSDDEAMPLKLDAEMVKQAQQLIDQTQVKLSDPELKSQAQALVNQSESFVGKKTFDLPAQTGVLANGIDIGQLIAQYKNPYQEKESPTEGKELPTLMVFISSSMPNTMLMDLAEQTKKAGGVMVLNGFIDSKLSNTILYMKQIIDETEVMINIDPNMFELFKVKSVPEIVVTSEPLKPCSPDQGQCEYQIPTHDRMKGNVTLYYALEQFSWSGDTSSTALEHLSLLQSEQWNNSDEAN